MGGVTRTSEPTRAIVTCPASEGMVDLHSRMPLILERGDWERWLEGERLGGTLEGFERYPVSRVVNCASNDVPACVEPIEDPSPRRL